MHKDPGVGVQNEGRTHLVLGGQTLREKDEAQMVGNSYIHNGPKPAYVPRVKELYHLLWDLHLGVAWPCLPQC